MIIYNVTINIEESISQEWLCWMQKIHIPEVMNTGMFISAKMTRVMVEEQMGVIIFDSIFMRKQNLNWMNTKFNLHQKLQQKHTQKIPRQICCFPNFT